MKRRNKDVIPIGVSIALILISLYRSLMQDYILGTEHYLGMIALAVCTILYMVNKKIYVFVFAFTLVLGLISVIDFYYVTFKISAGIVSVNPIFIVLVVLYFAFSKDTMNELLPEKNKFPDS